MVIEVLVEVFPEEWCDTVETVRRVAREVPGELSGRRG